MVGKCRVNWGISTIVGKFRGEIVGIFKIKGIHIFCKWRLIAGKSIELNGYGYGSIPINTIFRGMNIHLPAILMFTRGTRF